MALTNLQKINWDKFLTKATNPEVRRRVNVIRGKANEITASSAKYSAAPAAIDFAAYKSKLRFTGSAVSSLEEAYKNKQLPTYTATLPAFEVQKRSMQAAVSKNLAELATLDLQDLNAALDEFEGIRVSKDTSVSELFNRFPTFAKEIETEIKHHQWTN